MPTKLNHHYRRWRSAIELRIWACLGKKPRRVFYANGGIGDELMLTAVAAAARAMNRPISILARYPEIWRNNPDPASLHTDIDRWHYTKLRGWIDTDIAHVSCQLGGKLHLAEQMAERAGVTLPPNWRPVFHLVASGPRDFRTIVVQNSCRGALYRSDTKEWAQARWQELVNRLVADGYRIQQLGTASDPVLANAEDLRGKTSLSAAAGILAIAGTFVGLESGLQHLAAAARTPSVIIFGGRSLPHHTGYPFNHNIVRTPACAGCGLNTGCPHEHVCMDIPVDEVEAAVRQTISNSRAATAPPLPWLTS